MILSGCTHKIIDDGLPFEGIPMSQFSQGLMAVKCAVNNDKWGYMDINGDWIIPAQFDKAYHFSNNGRAIVTVDEKDGVID